MALLLAFAGLSFAQSDSQAALEEVVKSFEQGNAAEAERRVIAILGKEPANLHALILAGAVLDSQRRYDEAESYYRRALRVSPNSAQVLNNMGNHYLARGNASQAREFYLKAVAADPSQPNANLQLARISVEEKQGRAALGYLGRLPQNETSDPGIVLLRARALGLAGQCAEAMETAGRLESAPDNDSRRRHFSLGMIFAGCGSYERAEKSFSRALDADPRSFDVLYNLGLAALHAGHAERAAGVFEISLLDHPDDVDCLYALAQAYVKLDRPIDSAALLAKAEKLAPKRPDVPLLLAEISAQLEFYQDAAASYDRYLQLKPSDEVARRERAFMLASTGQFKNALPELERYAKNHPRDGIGFYELAVSQAFEDRSKAILSLDRALALDAQLTQARYTRAMLNLEIEKPAASIDDLQFLLAREPRNYHVLTRLGAAYLALNRAQDAEQVLKQALNLAPEARSVLLVYQKALEKLGRRQEAAEVLSRLEKFASAGETRRSRAGLIDYLSLPPTEQRARYLANLRKRSAADAGDFQWKIRLGRELLADGKTAEALALFGEIESASSDTEVLGRCGSTLLQFEQYEGARRFLEAAVAARPSHSAMRLDLAIVLFHLQGAQLALRELDKTPVADRKGDYYLLRAQLLDSLGKVPEAADALNRGMQAAPTKASLYFQAASFLLKHSQNREALALLEQANSIIPDVRELLLAQWVTLILLQHDIDAKKLLARIQARWPEWDHPYLLNGIFLEMLLHSSEARKSLETAIALGANTPEVYYYQALAITHSAPDDVEAAENTVTRALAVASKDPWVYLLAGKISLARKDYSTAIRRLLEAKRLEPALIPARYALRTAYKAVGDEAKSAAELEEIKRIGQENAVSDQRPVADFLFTVRPPS